MSRRLCGLAAGLVLAAAVVWAAPDDAAIRKLQEKFIAPCCWSESVAVHRSEIAEQMRAEIARAYRAGVAEKEIKAQYVAQYGERILMEPTGTKFTWLIVIPVVVSLLAAAGLIVYLRRRQVVPAAQAEAGALTPVPDEELEW